MKAHALIMIILIFSTNFIYANLNNTLQLNNPDTDIYFAGDEAVACHEGKIYATYYEKEGDYITVKLAVSEDNGNSFDFHTIADDTWLGSWHDNYITYKAPIITITDYDALVIVFCSLSNLEEWSQAKLIAAQGFTEAPNEYIEPLDFSIKVVSDYLNGDFSISICNGTPQISYFENRYTNLGQYAFFYDKPQNNENPLLPFWGSDVLHGPLFSNEDLWIGQFGGGDNNGWPIFNDIVETAGEIRHYPTGENLYESGAPMEDIFRGEPEPGWFENCPEIDMNDFTLENEDYISPFDPEADIVYVKINGASYDAMQGYIEVVDTLEIPVLSWFPHNTETANAAVNNGYNWFEEADTIWVNHIPVYDTTWVYTSGAATDNIIYVESELWIEGEVLGVQTWCCSDTVYLTSDIYYTCTAPGLSPSDPDNPNFTDFFTLLSEKSILIKYKHRDPFNDMQIVSANCLDVYLYGLYAAVGEGDEEIYGDNAHYYDGQFTFEYQHPHGSTPSFSALSPYTLQDTIYTYIDLHKYIYPPQDLLPDQISSFNLHGNNPPNALPCGYPFESNEYLNSYPNSADENPDYEYAVPYGTDYPWLNPVWPESAQDIGYERGAIHLFGGIIQRRWGYIHRSGSDDNSHSTNGEYDLENFIFDGDHPSTGYDRDYHYDERMKYSNLPFGIANLTYDPVLTMSHVFIRSYMTHPEFHPYRFTKKYNIDYQQGIEPKVFNCALDDLDFVIAWISESQMHLYQLTDLLNYSEINLSNPPTGELCDVVFVNSNNLKLDMLEEGVHHIYNYNISENDFTDEVSFEEQYNPSDFALAGDGEKLFITFNESQEDFSIYQANEDSHEYSAMNWQPDVISEFIMPEDSHIALDFNEDDSLYIFFNQHMLNTVPYSDLYFSSGYVEGVTPADEEDLPQQQTYLTNYPNPFNPSGAGRGPETTIEFSVSEKVEKADIRIYNIKGQLVRSFQLKDCKQLEKSGAYSITWDGRDSTGKGIATGVYNYLIKINNEKILTRKMILLK